MIRINLAHPHWIPLEKNELRKKEMRAQRAFASLRRKEKISIKQLNRSRCAVYVTFPLPQNAPKYLINEPPYTELLRIRGIERVVAGGRYFFHVEKGRLFKWESIRRDIRATLYDYAMRMKSYSL